ncbi:MAG TPA: HEAT repeat domain-containing protein, partial [Candidatus Polarisedimenticolaceae bacterium]|nr:HEAT repeat domain-containing protein [Candidatus Polarisedimenticolaceae bacterium]
MDPRPTIIRLTAIALALAGAPCATPAQDSPIADELIRQEEIRQTIEDALELYFSSDGDRMANILASVGSVADLGDDAVPFLSNELAQQDPRTFFFAAYSLGRIRTEGAARALREAIETAESQQIGEWPMMRKAWACWGLGMTGDPEAVTLLDSGRHLSGLIPVGRQFTVLESAAVHTAPLSLEALHRLLKTLDDEIDPRTAYRRNVLDAIRRLGDPASTEVLIDLVDNGPPALRDDAAHALGAIDTPEAKAVLLARLDLPDPRARRGVVLGLQIHPPTGGLDPVFARLAVETDAVIRGVLYDIIVRAGGQATTERLLAQWGKPDPQDRAQLAALLPYLDRDKVQDVLAMAVRDRATSVAYNAAEAAARLGDDRAIALLIDVVRSAELDATSAIQFLGELRVEEAGDVLAWRLIDVELRDKRYDSHRRDRVIGIGRALVDVGYGGRIDDLKQATVGLEDPKLVGYLEQLTAELELLATNRDKTKRWIPMLASDDPRHRELAYAYFARAGDPRAGDELIRAFGRVEPSEGVRILDALGGIDTAASRELIARVLTAPEFDDYRRAELREMAAWSARRLGMYDTLVAAVERRRGRDFLPLVYAAVLGGERALELLGRYRIERLDYIGEDHGVELTKIDWMRIELSHGRSI